MAKMNDTISRQAAIKAFKDLPDCPNGYSDTYDKACIIGVLEELPSVEKHGKWKQVWDDFRCRFVYECSACGQPRSGVSEWNYCPSCGAKMDLK